VLGFIAPIIEVCPIISVWHFITLFSKSTSFDSVGSFVVVHFIGTTFPNHSLLAHFAAHNL
jgi:hypothetical protein